GDQDCTARELTRELTMRIAKTCTATFTPLPTPPSTPPETTQPTPPPSPPGLSPCAAVTINEAQRAHLRRLAQGVPALPQGQDIPRPFCDVIELLEPFKKYSESQAFGLTVRLNKAGPLPLYLRGDNLIVDGQTPKAFASHVYIDNYSADGQTVGHLLPND